MKLASLLVVPCALIGISVAGRPAVQQEPGRSALSADTVRMLDGMVGSSQQDWGEAMPAARDAMSADPRSVIEYLVGKLAVDQGVPGNGFESQYYNVCGNALTLLERLTDVRVCGLQTDWFGFTTHDHRSARPSREKIQGPWQVWLEVRAGLPVDEWFWGMSHAELRRISTLMRRPEAEWEPRDVQAVHELGRKAFPYLLDKLLDNQVAWGDLQFCTQANVLLRRLTGIDLGEIERAELLQIDPDHPDRKYRLAILRNKAARALAQRRWTAQLLTRASAGENR